MNVVAVGPDDILYPLDRLLYEDPRVMYHGTSSQYSQSIERDGWVAGATPYGMEDVGRVCDAFDALHFFGSEGHHYSVLKAWTRGAADCYVEAKPISFAGDYWFARNYARAPGGETVEALTEAIKEFTAFLNDSEAMERHRIDLMQEISRAEAVADPDRIRHLSDSVRKLDDHAFLDRQMEVLERMERTYRGIVAGHKPVVYAVKVDEDWFDRPDHRTQEDWLGRWEGSSSTHNIPVREEFRPKASIKIPPTRILARVEFPHGARLWSPFAGKPLPIPWLTPQETVDMLWSEYRRCFGDA